MRMGMKMATSPTARMAMKMEAKIAVKCKRTRKSRPKTMWSVITHVTTNAVTETVAQKHTWDRQPDM